MTPNHRKPWQIILWGLLTGGVAFAWYYFIAFREVDFAAGRRHSGLLFLFPIPLVGLVAAIVYVNRELESLSSDRVARGLMPAIPPPWHHLFVALACIPGVVAAILLYPLALDNGAWWIIPAVLLGWSPAVVVGRVARDVNGLWASRAAATHATSAAPPRANGP